MSFSMRVFRGTGLSEGLSDTPPVGLLYSLMCTGLSSFLTVILSSPKLLSRRIQDPLGLSWRNRAALWFSILPITGNFSGTTSFSYSSSSLGERAAAPSWDLLKCLGLAPLGPLGRAGGSKLLGFKSLESISKGEGGGVENASSSFRCSTSLWIEVYDLRERH